MLSSSDQQIIQTLIEQSNAEERDQLHVEAENTLAQVNRMMGRGVLPSDVSKAAERAIEILMRLEATEKRKGWLWRSKRRLQLTQMYLGS